MPDLPGSHLAQLLQPAQPTRGSTVFFLLPGGEAAACPVHRRATPAPPCLRAPRLPGRLHAYHAASSTLSHSPSSSSPPLARSLTPTEHALHHRRRPPWLPRPPRPTTVSPSSVVLLFLSSSTHATPGAAERHPPSSSSPFMSGGPRGRIRRRRGLPEPNETANDPAVSSTPFPLLRFARPCSVASSPMSPCVRRRARSSPASFPATPRPPVRSFGCGRARGPPWCQQRDKLSSLTRVRRALAIGLVIAGVDLAMLTWL